MNIGYKVGELIYDANIYDGLNTFLFSDAKLLQKSEMRKDIVIELSYKGFG